MTEKQKINPWLMVFRVLFTLGLVVTVAFIFERSLQDAAASTAESTAALGRMNSFLQRHGISLTMHEVRKLAHFVEYLVLGGWLQLCLRVYTRHFLKHMSLPLFCGMAVALADETIQLEIAGRSSSVLDVWLDFFGVCSGVALAFCVLCMFHILGRIILKGRR